MGSFFRSEEMAMSQIFLPTDSAYFCVAELGELGQVQFRDLNPDVNAFQRRYVNEVRRCDEMERQLRYTLHEIKKESLPVPDCSPNDVPKTPPPKDMIDMEATFSKIEDELKEINTNGEELRRTNLELFEVQQILTLTQQFFDQRERTGSFVQREDGFQLMPTDNINLTFVAGVIPREKIMSFERLLWRVCRGNVFLRQVPIEMPFEDPNTGAWNLKNVIIVFFQGEQLKAKVKKILQAFHANTYPIADSSEGRHQLLDKVRGRLEDLKKVRQETQDHRNRVLVAAARKISQWFIQVRKMKATYHTLNMCNMDITSKCLLAEAWVPVADIQMVQEALNKGQEDSKSSVNPILNRMDCTETPPTYNRGNRFTSGFQNIIDAYGIASYQEFNPMPFTIITFPFLFAVMFGDAGHGILMFLFALWMVLCERSLIQQKIDDEIWNTFFGGRYIILLMGIFSIYTGMIYNDIFSKSANIFGSSWVVPSNMTLGEHTKDAMLVPEQSFTGSPYFFGLDPAWLPAGNKISFTNSFKMKTSVVLGVIQMLFGVLLSLGNHLFHKDMLSVYTEFIPQILFLCLIFGYLVIMILMKWISFYANPFCAPSLLIKLINMFMMSYPEYDEATCFDAPVYAAAPFFEKIFVSVALICVPWMLFIKPFILRSRHQAAQQMRTSSSAPLHLEQGSENGEAPKETPNGGAPAPAAGHGHGAHGAGGEFNFGDVFINQIIHTIEYALGCVSHTASYLRLWALSLAHAQLSEVLWTMVFSGGISAEGPAGFIFTFLCFAAWAFLTIAVLLVMEGLSAFLHALRLHWVEFQSKFYHGDGYVFVPFNFKQMLSEAETEDRAIVG